MDFLDLQGYGGMLFAGAGVTVLLAMTALPFGIFLGLLGAGAKLSQWRALRWSAEIYTAVIRGVPEILTILLIYYGLTVVIESVSGMLGAGVRIDIDPFFTGVTALGVTFGGYAAEVFRGAILAIARGQIEAARAVGMSSFLVFRRIVLPQMWRFALPGLGNLWLVLLKDTSVVSVIALDELMRNTRIAVGATQSQPFTFFGIAALLYLGMTAVSVFVFQRLELRARRGVKMA